VAFVSLWKESSLRLLHLALDHPRDALARRQRYETAYACAMSEDAAAAAGIER